MESAISTYLQETKKSFQDFMNHELISKDPFSLSEEEVMIGIRERSKTRAQHRCEIINRMNSYCTLVTISGHRLITTDYKTAKYGVFYYAYNNSVSFEMLYSTFIYPHVFSDEGMVRKSFGGSGKEFYVMFDILNGDKRQSEIVTPESIFNNPSKFGLNIFLEYSLKGINKFGSIKHLPSFVNIDEMTPSFIYEVRKSLLKTKFVMLLLVDKYPSHLMHEAPVKVLANSSLVSEFNAIYKQEMQFIIKDSLADTRLLCQQKSLSINIPF